MFETRDFLSFTREASMKLNFLDIFILFCEIPITFGQVAAQIATKTAKHLRFFREHCETIVTRKFAEFLGSKRCKGQRRMPSALFSSPPSRPRCPDDASQKRFSWFSDWIQKVQRNANIMEGRMQM